MARSPSRQPRPRQSASRHQDAALRRLADLPAEARPTDAAGWSALVSAGLAAEIEGRIVPTPAGQARLRRLAATQLGTPEWLAQHTPLRPAAETDGLPRDALVDEGESPLAWLRRRKDKEGRPLIDAAAFAAGERLRADITRAGIMPRVTADWSSLGGRGAGGRGGAADVLHGSIAARQRLDHAIKAVGSDFAGLLLDVCGFLKGLETVEAERGWPARSAKVVLAMALRRLADHYGYAPAAHGPGGSLGIRAWTATPSEATGP